MLRVPTLPGAFTRVLATFRPCFTAPTFQTFTMLVAGLLAQPVARTVCGMLTGAGLARVWHHSRAHRFFSHARWNPGHLGLLLAELTVTQLLPAGAPITVSLVANWPAVRSARTEQGRGGAPGSGRPRRPRVAAGAEPLLMPRRSVHR